jgi:hypothetical protein
MAAAYLESVEKYNRTLQLRSIVTGEVSGNTVANLCQMATVNKPKMSRRDKRRGTRLGSTALDADVLWAKFPAKTDRSASVVTITSSLSSFSRRRRHRGKVQAIVEAESVDTRTVSLIFLFVVTLVFFRDFFKRFTHFLKGIVKFA